MAGIHEVKDRLVDEAVRIWRSNKKMTPLSAARAAARQDASTWADADYWVLQIIGDVVPLIDDCKRQMWQKKHEVKSRRHIH